MLRNVAISYTVLPPIVVLLFLCFFSHFVSFFFKKKITVYRRNVYTQKEIKI